MQATEAIDPALATALGISLEPSPLHVLLVGSFMTNATVSRVGDDVAVFHCLEWFQSPEGTRVLVAHEGSHGWHEIALERRGERAPDDDMAWMVFSEGMATEASRAAVPGMEAIDYFWYGHPEAKVTVEAPNGDGPAEIKEGDDLLLARIVATAGPGQPDVSLAFKAAFAAEPIKPRVKAGVRPPR